MPTCWDGKLLGDDNDHKSHMSYTVNGKVAGACPSGYPRRVPQIQLFVRLNNYMGKTHSYQLSDGNKSGGVWHVDFFNGWKEGKLDEIINNCEIEDQKFDEYNPGCQCTEFLTKTRKPATPMCDRDVRRLIVDEKTDAVSSALPRGTCKGKQLIPKSWNGPNLPKLADCGGGFDEDEDGGGGGKINFKKKANQCANKVLTGKGRCKCFATKCIQKKMTGSCMKGLGTAQQKKKLRNMAMNLMKARCASGDGNSDGGGGGGGKINLKKKANRCANKVLTGKGRCKCWAMQCLQKKMTNSCMKGLSTIQQKNKLRAIVVEKMETRCEGR